MSTESRDDKSESTSETRSSPSRTGETFTLTPLGATKIAIRKIKPAAKSFPKPSTSKAAELKIPARKSFPVPGTRKIIPDQTLDSIQAKQIISNKRPYNQDTQILDVLAQTQRSERKDTDDSKKYSTIASKHPKTLEGIIQKLKHKATNETTAQTTSKEIIISDVETSSILEILEPKVSTSNTLTTDISKLDSSTSKTHKRIASPSDKSRSNTPISKSSKSKKPTLETKESKTTTSKASPSKISRLETTKPDVSELKETSSEIFNLDEKISGASNNSNVSTSNSSISKTPKPKTSTRKPSSYTTIISKKSKSKTSTLGIPTTSKNVSEASTSTETNLITSKKPTSTKSFTVDPSKIEDPNFWTRTLRGNFNTDEYKKSLVNNDTFTGNQAEILQQSFYHLSNKMSNVLKNHRRIRKTHKCFECDFWISHQCLPYDCIRGAMTLLESIIEHTPTPPEKTVFCTFCQFAFFHHHRKRVRPRVKYTTEIFLEEVEQKSFDCPLCYLNIEIKQRQRDPCDGFRRWTNLGDDGESQREKFHKSLDRVLQKRGVKKLSFDDLYACENNCCLFFHRCDENSTEQSIPIGIITS